jgi:Cu/Ag efflux protein CusF
MKSIIIVVALFALVTPLSALSNDAHHKITAATEQPNASLTEGEVRKVDKDAKKITIRHAAIQKLEMPAMTMVFQVKDPAMLEQVKAGDKIRFEAEKISGQFFVTRIESSK